VAKRDAFHITSMSDYHQWPSLRAVTPTICGLLGIQPPTLCKIPPLEEVRQAAREMLKGLYVQKCLLYAPDAMGRRFRLRNSPMFEAVLHHAPIEVVLQSVVPPKTPVCFASMFTGAAPREHGIIQYAKPVLQCDTLFDALLRAEKRVAIVAVKDCSIDRIFRDRSLDYFSEKYDPDVTERVISLLTTDRHDFILAYHQGYDDTLHAETPYSEKALQAARNHVAGFARMAEAFDRHWERYRRMIVFAPDHGAHTDTITKQGTHGEDIPEDMELAHFYGIR
jgi:hypothetical protein